MVSTTEGLYIYIIQWPPRHLAGKKILNNMKAQKNNEITYMYMYICIIYI